jgi:hypothetical protein
MRQEPKFDRRQGRERHSTQQASGAYVIVNRQAANSAKSTQPATIRETGFNRQVFAKPQPQASPRLDAGCCLASTREAQRQINIS